MSKILPFENIEFNHTFSSSNCVKDINMNRKGPSKRTLNAILEFSKSTEFLNSSLLNETIEISNN